MRRLGPNFLLLEEKKSAAGATGARRRLVRVFVKLAASRYHRYHQKPFTVAARDTILRP